jgi:hypothetical protein
MSRLMVDWHLFIQNNMTITGPTDQPIIIDGGGLNSVIRIAPSSATLITVSIANLTIQNALSSQGEIRPSVHDCRCNGHRNLAATHI